MVVSSVLMRYTHRGHMKRCGSHAAPTQKQITPVLDYLQYVNADYRMMFISLIGKCGGERLLPKHLVACK